MLRILSLLLIIIGAGVLAFAGKNVLIPTPELTDGGATVPPPLEMRSETETNTIIEEANAPEPLAALERTAALDVETLTNDIVESGLSALSTPPVETFASSLTEVPIAYEKPDSAQVGVPFDVTLVIDGTGDTTAADDLPGEASITESSAQVSSSVSAVLSGSGFEIATRSPIRQTLSPFESNRWQWRVTPVKEGSGELTMEIFAHLEGTALPVRTYRDTLPVEITPIGRVINLATQANPVAAVLGGLGSLIAGLFGAARFFGRKEAA